MIRYIIFASVLINPSLLWADAGQCHRLFQIRFGSFRAGFEHSSKYDVEVAPSRVKDQCGTSHCHMYSWTAELERVSGIDLSSAYLDAMRLMGQSMQALRSGKADLDLGAFIFASRNSIRAYGLIPESAWKGYNDFFKSPYYSRLEETLQSFVVQNLGKAQLIKNATKKEKFYLRAERELLEIVENMTGAIPKSFEYEGKTYTPKSFAHKFFPELYEPVVQVEMNRKVIGVVRKASEIDRLELQMNFEKAELVLRQVIDSGQTAALSYRHKRQFVDSKTGVMSIDAFVYPKNAGVLLDKEMVDHALWGGAHAVRVVGYELDPQTGRVRKWKIQNSWGDKIGEQGHYHMYRDYFEKFAWSFMFVQDPNIVLPRS